jgi:predicted protein tyrosine phosphatase
MIVSVQDSEYDDILIHLPDACRFIQNAVDGGGRVLVHCHMGISRSATVIAAYCEIVPPWNDKVFAETYDELVMSTRHMPVHKAIATIKRGP